MPGEAFFLSLWVRYLLGPGLIAIGGLAGLPWGLLPVGVGWLMVAGSTRAVDVALGRQEARRVLDMLLRAAVTQFESQAPPEQRNLRANIMLVDTAASALRIAYRTLGYDEGEEGLTWGKGQGCCGLAWEQKKTVFAPADVKLPVTPADADLATRPYNMTKEQILLTAERIKTVISAPIFHPERQTEILGILSLDDEKVPDESVLGNSHVQASIEQLAEQSDVRTWVSRGGRPWS